jgi:hypothetical protein
LANGFDAVDESYAFRAGFDEVRKSLFQCLGDPAMQGLARATQRVL